MQKQQLLGSRTTVSSISLTFRSLMKTKKPLLDAIKMRVTCCFIPMCRLVWTVMYPKAYRRQTTEINASFIFSYHNRANGFPKWKCWIFRCSISITAWKTLLVWKWKLCMPKFDRTITWLWKQPSINAHSCLEKHYWAILCKKPYNLKNCKSLKTFRGFCGKRGAKPLKHTVRGKSRR